MNLIVLPKYAHSRIFTINCLLWDLISQLQFCAIKCSHVNLKSLLLILLPLFAHIKIGIWYFCHCHYLLTLLFLPEIVHIRIWTHTFLPENAHNVQQTAHIHTTINFAILGTNILIVEIWIQIADICVMNVNEQLIITIKYSITSNMLLWNYKTPSVVQKSKLPWTLPIKSCLLKHLPSANIFVWSKVWFLSFLCVWTKSYDHKTFLEGSAGFVIQNLSLVTPNLLAKPSFLLPWSQALIKTW